jgi:DtxR family Mn-dependent transcriptional regulator
MVGMHERDISASLEHYVDAVHALRRERGYARVVDVAERLAVTKATVSSAMHALVERRLVRLGEHRFLELTPEGVRLAESLESRNAVLRHFLQDVLGVPPVAAEVDACRMEHAVGNATIDRLVDLIRFFESEDPKVRAVLERFRSFRRTCDEKGVCQECEYRCAASDLLPLRPLAKPRAKRRERRS